MRHSFPLVSALLLATSTTVLADTTLKMQQSGMAGDGTSVTYIKDGKVRVDTGDGSYMLFDSPTRTMTIITPAERKYMVMDEAYMASVGNMMEQARAQMEAQLANLPPEQRERMREMMGDRFGALMGGEPQPEPEINHTGEEKTINGYSCEVVTITVEGTMEGTACIASRAELGVPESDYQTMRALMAFSQSMAEQLAQNGAMPQGMAELDGLPVQYHSRFDNLEISGTLNSVSTAPLADNLFTIPADYQQQQMPKMPMG